MQASNSAFDHPDQIRAMQENKLREMMKYLAQHSPFYREMFQKEQIDPEQITRLEHLQQLPVTSKEDIQLRNWDFCCVPRQEIAEYMSSSGTLGSPVTIALTEKDLQRLAYNEYCSFTCAGGTADDTYQLMLTLDRQFMAGIAYYMGIRAIGAAVVRVGPGAPFLQWETIQRTKPTILVGVPSFLVKMIEYAEQQGIDLASSSVKTAICIGESIRNDDHSLNKLGEKIHTGWNIQLISTYASTEMQTAFTECSFGMGGHLNPELLILELLDENNQPVAPGEEGEVTVTTLGIEGMPLLRYKTGDICRIFDSSCTCGRHTPRLSAIIGRKKQMIKLKGTSLYPPAIFDVLNELPELADFVVELQRNEWNNDEVLLHLQLKNPEQRPDGKIKELLRSRLRVIPEIRFVSAAELHRIQFPEGGRKAQKLIDSR